MKRLTRFLSIFLIMGLGIITIFSIKPKANTPLNHQESIILSLKDTDIDDGYDNGYDDGYAIGYENGFDDGYDNGVNDGYAIGYDNGYDDGYDNGVDDGYGDGFNDGFNAGLDEVFNTNNLMPLAEIRQRGTYGPSSEFFAFTMPINKKVKSITILNLFDYPLKPIDWLSSSGNMRQGFNVGYDDQIIKFYSFSSQINDFSNVIYFEFDENKVVEYITIALALNNASMPDTDYEPMIEHMTKNIGVYINNNILNDDAIAKFKEILKLEIKSELGIGIDEDFYTLLERAKDEAFDEGYNEGIEDASDNTFFGLISQVFTGLGKFLSIELLPNITFGAIISVPLVFGIIAFIIGKRGGKDD